MTIEIKHSKVVTADDGPDASPGMALKADWNAPLVISPSSFATDEQVIEGTLAEPKLYTVEQLKLAAETHGSGGVIQDIPFANITAAPNLTNTDTIIFGDLTGNAVTPTPVNGVIGKTYDFIWHQDATGGRNVTFAGVNYGAGAAGTYMAKGFKCVAPTIFVLVWSS